MGEIEGHVESESTGKARVNVNGARLESRRALPFEPALLVLRMNRAVARFTKSKAELGNDGPQFVGDLFAGVVVGA